MKEMNVDYMIKMKKSNKEGTIERLVPYIREVIGDRSIRQASADMGIAASYLSGMLKGKYMPSAEILRKMTDEKALPQRGVTLEDLMVAAGYQEDYVFSMVEKMVKSDENSESQMARICKYFMKYERTARAIILSELVQKNLTFSQANEFTGEVKGYKPDLVLNVLQQTSIEWWFEFHFISDKQVINKMDLRRMLGLLIFIPPKIERKISYVVNNISVFEALAEYAGQLSYRGDLSVILVDTEEMRIQREVYLSHYQEHDTRSEFYIV